VLRVDPNFELQERRSSGKRANPMGAKSFYLFQCGTSDFYALSTQKHAKRRLPRDLCDGDWELRSTVTFEDLGPSYIEAEKLVSRTGVCILRLGKFQFDLVDS
jgi:hypothetical protein